MLSTRRTVFIAVLLLLVRAASFAQEPASVDRPYAGALILFTADSAADVSPVVVRVIASAVREYLEEIGVVVVEAHEAQRYEDFTPDLELDARIQLVDDGASVHYSLSLPGSTRILTELDYSQSVGLNLDRAVAESMVVLLDQADSFVRAAAAGRRDNPVHLELRPVESAAAAVSRGGDAASDAEAGPADSVEGPAVQFASGTTDARVEIAMGLAPLFSIGRSANYFSAAFGADLRVAVLVGAARGLSAGISSRVIYSIAQGAATFADLLLIPVGVDIRIVGHTPFSPTAYLSGGVAVLRAVNPILGPFTKLVPSGIAGVGMTMRFASGFGIAAQIDFSAYFEGSTVIMGFSPTVTANMEL